jgi:hypothetical protein
MRRHARFVLGVFEVERRADVEAADVDVTEHGVAQALGVEEGAKLAHVGLQVLGRNDGVFDEGHGLARAGRVAEQADALLAQVPQALSLGRLPGQRVAVRRAERALAARDLGDELFDLGLHVGFVVAGVFDQVDGARRRVPGVQKKSRTWS